MGLYMYDNLPKDCGVKVIRQGAWTEIEIRGERDKLDYQDLELAEDNVFFTKRFKVKNKSKMVKGRGKLS